MKSFIPFRRRLLDWFDRNGRHLPWRDHRTAYRVWVSEIMLQQTTTETVRGYFDRFCAQFPDVSTLAAAETADVLKRWEGLGYYRRAVQMHAAARVIVERYGGEFPDEREAILALPGVGRYTAGAILSFAFDRREPILEANTLRLDARLLGLESDPATGESQKRLWAFAEAILPKTRCGDFNQALIDLGNGVCLPKEPRCEVCPLFTFCEAKRLGKVDLIPYKKPVAPKERRTEIAFLVRRPLFTGAKPFDQEKFLLIRSPEGARWAGLWDFPRFLYSDRGADAGGALHAELEGFLGSGHFELGPVLKRRKHVVTRFDIELLFYETLGLGGHRPSFDQFQKNGEKTIRFAAGEVSRGKIVFCWADQTEARRLPMNSTAKQLLAAIPPAR